MHSCANTHRCKQKNTNAHICTHILRLIMKFHSSPVWNFFLIKFHLLQLGFHHPITDREAEALVHAWFHQAPGEYQSMPPILFYFLPLFSCPLPAPLSSTHRPPLISAISQSFHSPKFLPRLFAPLVHIPHPASWSHVRHTALLSRTTTALRHPRHSTMTEHHWPTASYGL